MAFGKKIDEVREDLIGLKVVDIEEEGKVVYLKNEEGRIYSIDFTGKGGAVVYRGTTDEEKFEDLETMFDLLLQKLDIDEEELWKLYE